MKASDELFHLIRSLTPSEKRYFKTNAKKESATSNYLQLFDAIDSQKEYDEPALKKKHEGKKFVKYLSAEKGYLHDQIMKQMRAYHADRTIDNKINELLQDEAFYRAKGLNDLRKKALDKARGLAEEYERFHLLQEIILRQINFVEEFARKTLEGPINELLKDMSQVQNLTESLSQLIFLKRKVFSFHRSGADIKNDSVKSEIDKTYENLKNLNSSLPPSFRLRSYVNVAFADYAALKGNRQEAFEWLMRNYEMYQENPKMKQEQLNSYRLLVSNLMGRLANDDDEELFGKLSSELKTLPVDSFNAEGEIFQNVFFLEHLRFINQGKLHLAEALVPDINSGLLEYGSKINKARELSFKCNIMVMYFILHKFDKAKDYADDLLSQKGEIKQGVLTLTRIIYPIVHYELGHIDLVENLTRSSYRYLLKLKRLYGFERLMIKYLDTLPFNTSKEEFANSIAEFANDLQALRADPNELNTPGFEEIELWVKSKVTGEPMHQLLASK